MGSNCCRRYSFSFLPQFFVHSLQNDDRRRRVDCFYPSCCCHEIDHSTIERNCGGVKACFKHGNGVVLSEKTRLFMIRNSTTGRFAWDRSHRAGHSASSLRRLSLSWQNRIDRPKSNHRMKEPASFRLRFLLRFFMTHALTSRLRYRLRVIHVMHFHRYEIGEHTHLGSVTSLLTSQGQVRSRAHVP